MPKKAKLKPFIFEMHVEGIINNHEQNTKGWKMLRLCGVITESNFLEEGSRFCFPLVGRAIKRRVHVDDKVKITMFCEEKSSKKLQEESFIAHGAKYELWDDVNSSWSCIYERFDGDPNS